MIQLSFKGPFQFYDLVNEHDAYNPGIYIWGFVYVYKGSELVGPVDFTNPKNIFDKTKMKFIPYYVGKSQSNMFRDRLSKHHDVKNSAKNSDANKYTRLSHDYMKWFFKDPCFPIPKSYAYKNKICELILKDNPVIDSIKNSKVAYFNSCSILRNIYPGLIPKCVKENYPITEQELDGEKIQDTLFDIVVGKNNSWFCYASADVTKKKLSDCEATTFYSLKGKTIGKTKNCPKTGIQIEIVDNTDSSILKISESDKSIKPSEMFPGY